MSYVSPKVDFDVAVEAYARGATTADIAAIFGIHRNTLHNAMLVLAPWMPQDAYSKTEKQERQDAARVYLALQNWGESWRKAA